MKPNSVIFTAMLLTAFSLSSAQLKQFVSDKKESSIEYKLTHPLHEIESTSKEAYCSINADIVKKEIKQVVVKVDVTTFNSGNSNRDSHAMEVIDALSYPEANFNSTSISRQGDSLKVYGKLFFHGVTKDITISAAAVWGEKKLTINGKFSISLTAFKVERPSLLLIPVKDNLDFSVVENFNL